MGGPGIINPSLAEAVAYTRWFYGICMGFDRASAAVGAAGRVFIAAVEVRWPVRTDEFLYMVGAAQAGNVRVALYEDGPAGDIPATQSPPQRPHPPAAPDRPQRLRLRSRARAHPLHGPEWFASVRPLCDTEHSGWPARGGRRM